MKVALNIIARQRWAEAVLSQEVPAVAVSYAQLQRRSEAFCTDFFETLKADGAWVLLESGGHTFAPEDTDEADELCRQYIEFVGRYSDSIDVWTELDVSAFVDQERIRTWREWWDTAELADRLVVVYVSDEMDGAWRHVAVPGGQGAAFYDQFWARNLGRAKENGILVYGRGLASAAAMQQPWFAVDTTTWSAWGRWGHIFFWNAEKKRMHTFKQPDAPPEEKTRRRLEAFEAHDAWDTADELALTGGIREMNDDALNLWNMAQWKQLADQMAVDKRNAYWEDNRRLPVPKAAGEIVQMSDYAGTLTRGARALQIGRSCNGCSLSDRCPMFQADADCSLSELQPINGSEDVRSAVETLLSMQFDRVQFGMLGERMNGGHLDAQVTYELRQFMALLKDMKELSSTSEKLTITAEGGGIVSRVFGSLLNQTQQTKEEPEQVEVIDVSAAE